MYVRNNGKGELNILQNRFTAYLLTAVRRRKDKILRKRARTRRYEELTDFQNTPLEDQNTYNQDILLEKYFENTALEMAVRLLAPRDRYIFISRALELRSYEELAAELGLGYQGVAAAYHRVIKKLRRTIRGDTG